MSDLEESIPVSEENERIMKHRPHPIFRVEKPVKVSKYSRDEWRLLECFETGLVYLDNPVDYASLKKDYAWEKTYAKLKEEKEKNEPVFSKLSAMVKFIRRKVRKLPKIYTLPVDLCESHFADREVLNILDVGCGDGHYSFSIAKSIASKTGKQVIPNGIEISVELHKLADAKLRELGGEVVHSPAVEGMAELKDSSQNLVIMHSFLEHETDPIGLLEACRSKLSEDGLLIIKVPNFACWNRLVRQHKWCGFRFPDHVNYFSPNNLKLILEQAGFKIFQMNFFDTIPTSDNMWVVASK